MSGETIRGKIQQQSWKIVEGSCNRNKNEWNKTFAVVLTIKYFLKRNSTQKYFASVFTIGRGFVGAVDEHVTVVVDKWQGIFYKIRFWILSGFELMNNFLFPLKLSEILWLKRLKDDSSKIDFHDSEVLVSSP